MDKRFLSILERRELDPLFFKEIFETCTTYKKLRGEEYHIANTLAELGLMATKRIPIFNKTGSYIGIDVYFKSMFEDEEK